MFVISDIGREEEYGHLRIKFRTFPELMIEREIRHRGAHCDPGCRASWPFFLFQVFLDSPDLCAIARDRDRRGRRHQVFRQYLETTGSGGEVLNIIDAEGPVVSVIDLRDPGEPATGQPWGDAPIRDLVDAARGRTGLWRGARRCQSAECLCRGKRGVWSSSHGG